MNNTDMKHSKLIIRVAFSAVFMVLSCHFVYAQKAAADTGKVEFVQDYKVQELLNKHVEINSKAPIKGYRVKIHFWFR